MGPAGRASKSTTVSNESTSVNDEFASVRARPTTSNLKQETSFNTDITLKEDFISTVVIKFICERMNFDGCVVPEELKRMQEVDDRRAKRIALMILIRTHEDGNSSNELLDRLLCQIKISEEYFERAAQKIFEDGIDWRRIISLLYMSYRLTLKAAEEEGSIDSIILWLNRFFRQHLVEWISSNGGWMAMNKKYGNQHPVEDDENLRGVVPLTQNDETLPIDEADGTHARVTIDTSSFQNEGEFNFTSTITTVFADRLQEDGYEGQEELKTFAQNMVLTKEGRLIAKTLKELGDDLVNNRLLNQLCSKVILHAKLNRLNVGEVLLPIVWEILKDGINFGRIVMVIYLAYKLIIIYYGVTSLIFAIIEWVAQYLYEKLGGWEGLLELYYKATKSENQMKIIAIAAMVAGILTFGGGVYYLCKK